MSKAFVWRCYTKNCSEKFHKIQNSQFMIQYSQESSCAGGVFFKDWFCEVNIFICPCYNSYNKDHGKWKLWRKFVKSYNDEGVSYKKSFSNEFCRWIRKLVLLQANVYSKSTIKALNEVSKLSLCLKFLFAQFRQIASCSSVLRIWNVSYLWGQIRKSYGVISYHVIFVLSYRDTENKHHITFNNNSWPKSPY